MEKLWGIYEEVKTIRIVRASKLEFCNETFDGSFPWVADCRSFDIPPTIVGMIQNAAPGLVAVTLSVRGGIRMIQAAERAARKRGVRIIWWMGPKMTGDPPEGLILNGGIPS